MERWLPCRIALVAGKTSKIARVYLPDVPGALKPKMRVVMTLKHPNGTAIQVVGIVERILRRLQNYRYVSILIPWQAAVSLARLVGASVESGKKIELYDYTVQIEEANMPPLP